MVLKLIFGIFEGSNSPTAESRRLYMRHSAHGLGTSAPTLIAIVLLGVDAVYEFLDWRSSSSPTRVVHKLIR